MFYDDTELRGHPQELHEPKPAGAHSLSAEREL